MDEFGRLDVWVNYAGIARDASLRKMGAADFEAAMKVHLKGSWLGVRAAVDPSSDRWREDTTAEVPPWS
ncbi:3-oxoacyl-[acyl-carrier protein] reductase [Rhodococcus aetherivorans]|nr:3-oxoacyl-[acyl-carrier protein] reductase [Rhodococcus aetherivorans]